MSNDVGLGLTFLLITSLTVLQEWNVSLLSFEEDPEPFGRERDAAICALAQEAGVEVIIRTSHTLYPPQKYVMCSLLGISLLLY